MDEPGLMNFDVAASSCPKGWRQDKSLDRVVAVPPWSMRPPAILPEQWVLYGKKARAEIRAEWRTEDPDGFAQQEERRRRYAELRSGVTSAAVAVHPRFDEVIEPGGEGMEGVTVPRGDTRPRPFVNLGGKSVGRDRPQGLPVGGDECGDDPFDFVQNESA